VAEVGKRLAAGDAIAAIARAMGTSRQTIMRARDAIG
jgi:putative DNA-invertase from lambdoid prophage Rac